MEKSKNIFIWENCDNNKKKEILMRPSFFISKDITNKVKKIINNVKKNGDNALYYYNKIFDKVQINSLTVNKKEIENSYKHINENLKKCMLIAFKNIKKFHTIQNLKNINIETQKGIHCQQITRPISSVGLYIPGGNSSLFSTLFMLAIPATIAGCKNILICSPPPISYEILYAAKICNIKKIFKIGGAQAIAAFSLGTKSIPKVDKIFGPGNIWVTEAKRQISKKLNGTAIDMLAGPSELTIIADKTANPYFVSADLLSQAEHGSDSQVILLTTSFSLAENVFHLMYKQCDKFNKSEIIKKSLMHSRIIVTKNIKECIKISNIYGPEHLIIQTKNYRNLLKNINNAGSIFLGKWSPESAGDYASGTNHVLPTYGNVNTFSGLGVLDFQKRITVQELKKNGFINLSSTIKILADAENMQAHKNAVEVRLNFYRKKYERKSC